MNPWDIAGWIVVGYLAGAGLRVIADPLIAKFSRRKDDQDSTVARIDEWRERNNPPRSS